MVGRGVQRNIKFINNPQIFITGINGFVGRNLQPYLAKYFDIQSISRKESSFTYEMFFKENRPYDSFIHLAGKAHDVNLSADECEYYEVNYELTKKLYDQFLHSDAQKFIYISSVKAAADKIEGVLTEGVMPNPVTPYGKSKLMAENYILANLLADKQVYILRPCMIHGKENKGNLNLLYRIVSNNIPWPLGAFENKRSFCGIDNFTFIVKELLERKDIPSGIYNVADDEPFSTNELIGLIAKSQNRNPKVWNFSKKFIEGLASIGDILHLPLNTERLQKLTSSYVVSNAKMKAAIGKPLPVSSREGLLKTFKSFNN